MTSNIMGEPIEHFRPEFVNRIDEIVRFRPLEQGDMGRIVDIQLGALRQRLTERRITLDLTDAALNWLAARGYDAAFGARPLKRLLQRSISDVLAKQLLAGEIPEHSVVRADAPSADSDGLQFSVSAP